MHGTHDHHHHEPCNHGTNALSAFSWGIGLNLGFVLIEGVCGWWANSMALWADAVHNLSDVLSLLLSWIALRLASWSPSQKRTYGYKRGTVLAAFLNAVLLFGALGGIVVESLHRLTDPAAVESQVVIIAALCGLVINTLSALLFLPHAHHELNAKSAWLHLIADAGVSLTVAVAGVIMYFFAVPWLDPALSITVALFVLWGTWGLFRDSLDLLLDAVPAHIPLGKLSEFLQSAPNVVSLHDLHVWALSTSETALSVHVVTSTEQVNDAWLQNLQHELAERFGISHATIQVEREPCQLMCEPASRPSADLGTSPPAQ